MSNGRRPVASAVWESWLLLRYTLVALWHRVWVDHQRPNLPWQPRECGRAGTWLLIPSPNRHVDAPAGVLGGRGKCATSRRMSVPRTMGRAASFASPGCPLALVIGASMKSALLKMQAYASRPVLGWAVGARTGRDPTRSCGALRVAPVAVEPPRLHVVREGGRLPTRSAVDHHRSPTCAVGSPRRLLGGVGEGDTTPRLALHRLDNNRAVFEANSSNRMAMRPTEFPNESTIEVSKGT